MCISPGETKVERLWPGVDLHAAKLAREEREEHVRRESFTPQRIEQAFGLSVGVRAVTVDLQVGPARDGLAANEDARELAMRRREGTRAAMLGLVRWIGAGRAANAERAVEQMVDPDGIEVEETK